MGKFAVAVIDGARARFFTLDSTSTLEHEPGPKLIEHEDLFNPNRKLQGKELWANTKTGRNHGSNGQDHSYDDHRQAHEVEFEKRFAQAIAQRLVEIIQTHQSKNLILVAEPQILGIMREAMTDSSFNGLNIKEIDKNISHLSSHEIHDYLAKKKLLPAFKRVFLR
ncbi:MAG: host attachment protein [Cyanobacteria bacterium J083]|nr:MAG: host attachment protein [Cyanobacteria bacterium J083]